MEQLDIFNHRTMVLAGLSFEMPEPGYHCWYETLEDCRNACVGIIRSNNWQNADYECGYKCKFKDGINICKETSR